MNLALFLSYFFYLVSLLLILEFLVFYLPGSQWNGPKRFLFKLSYPLLIFSDRYLVMRWSGKSTRGLLLALFLLGAGYGLGPHGFSASVQG